METEYQILEEGNAIVFELRNKYPNHFWTVVPDEVIVLGIANKTRPKAMQKLAEIRKVDDAYRTVVRFFSNKDIRYVIVVYISDWIEWSVERKQWIIAHEITHIGLPDKNSLVNHDIIDFGWILDAVGIDWWEKENLPNLLGEEPYPLRQELFDRLRGSPAEY